MKLWSRLALWLGQMLIGPELCPPSPLRMCRVWWSLRKVNMISRGRLRLWLARCPVVSAQCPVSVITLCNFAPGSPGPQSAELVLERLTHFHAVLVLRTYHIPYTPTEDVYDSSKWTQPLTVKEVSPSRGCADGPSHRPRVSRLPLPAPEWPVCPGWACPRQAGVCTLELTAVPALSSALASSVIRVSWAEQETSADQDTDKLDAGLRWIILIEQSVDISL